MNIIKHQVRNCRGQAIVEMAMVLPILIIVLFSVLEFGRLLNEKIVITAAAREGARAAAVGDSEAIVESKVRQAAITLDTEYSISVTVSSTGERGTPVTVSVTHPVRILTPLISSEFGLPNPYPVTAISVMRLE